jgi:hypothetical protein
VTEQLNPHRGAFHRQVPVSSTLAVAREVTHDSAMRPYCHEGANDSLSSRNAAGLPAREGTTDSAVRRKANDVPGREGTTESGLRRKANLFVGREGTNESGIFYTHWQGRCGFVSRLRPETPEGPWMCHHFTVDGEHCVMAGLGPEHANSCAGACRMLEAEAFQDLADPPRCMGLRKPVDRPGRPTLIKCGLPSRPCCSVDTCPFLANGRPCPFVKRFGADRGRDEEQTLARFNTEPTPHRVGGCGARIRSGIDGILIEPDPDDNMSPFAPRSQSL